MSHSRNSSRREACAGNSYPTRDGIPVSTAEIWLPDSHLDLNDPWSYNNHHKEWPARYFGRTALFSVLRNLEGMQERLPRDVHNIGRLVLHTLYTPPKPPTPLQAMDRIDRGYQQGEQLHVYNNNKRHYEYKQITDELYEKVKRDYDRLTSGE